MSLVGYQASKIRCFFGKITAEQVLKSFSCRNNSLKLPVFGFCDSLSFGFEESREQRSLIRCILVEYTLRNASNFCKKYFFAFLSCHYGFTYCFEILNFVFSNIIPRGVSTCKILTFQDQYFQKYKAQKIVKFSFSAFLADLFKFLPSEFMAL